MAISFVSFVATGGGAAEPAGVLSGDVLVAVALSNTVSAPGGPAGWAQAGTTLTVGANTANAWTIARGGSAPSYAWTNVGSGGVNVYAFRGASSTLDAVATGTATSAVAPSVNASAATDWLVCLYVDNASAAITAPAGMTEPGTPAAFGAGAYLALSASGATGTKTFGGTTTPLGAWSIALAVLAVPSSSHAFYGKRRWFLS